MSLWSGDTGGDDIRPLSEIGISLGFNTKNRRDDDHRHWYRELMDNVEVGVRPKTLDALSNDALHGGLPGRDLPRGEASVHNIAQRSMDWGVADHDSRPGSTSLSLSRAVWLWSEQHRCHRIR